VTLAKAIGGGVPTAAIGGSEEACSSSRTGVYQVGTFNRQPALDAPPAAKANLLRS